MNKQIFKETKEIYPQIYAYSLNEIYPNCLKIGYTTRKDVKLRIKEQFNIEFPKGTVPYKIEFIDSAIKENGDVFYDHDVHKRLLEKGIECVGGEWYKCSIEDVMSAVLAIKKGIKNVENRTQDFTMRPEQEDAVNKTIEYFKNEIEKDPTVQPRFLWNAKMRFGKTFATYQLAKRMNFKRILVLTYKPAVENSWKEDLLSHIDFEGWQFISSNSSNLEIDTYSPIVCFGSFQDYLGKNKNGGVKQKNLWVFEEKWDIIVFDEYHFGAWRESAKELYDDSIDYNQSTEEKMLINAKYLLYLSGTPFRAILSGEFTEEQIYNWTYADEQRAKKSWIGENNPYESLPEMILMTYKLPEEIKNIALKGEFNEFDLNEFFKAKGEKENAKFLYENEVQKWLDLIRGGRMETNVDNLKLGAEKPPLPFYDIRLKKILSHTLWFLPDISSCYAMKNLLIQPQNAYYHKFEVIVCAGEEAGIGIRAIHPLKKAMGNPLRTNTITLTCGKLTTGVTIKPWSGIFMLRNISSPETYFQSAFRVQSPWVIKSETETVIMKEQCFVFDFAPNRALHQVLTYCNKLNFKEDRQISIEDKVQEFLNFLPVLAYDGYAMEKVDAKGLLDIAMGRTTATLLAKGWNNTLLVNVDNDVLKRLINDEKAMSVIMSIEEFRNAKEDLNIIINKTESIKQMESKKKENGSLTKSEQNQLDKDKKERDKKREEIRSKLKTLATRMPLFMYLTDDRTKTLHELIYPQEPELFKKVTGLTHKDFEYLVDLGLFNSALMNHAIYNFRKYEEPSRSYTGINKRDGEDVGGFDGVITQEEFESL